MDPLSQGVVGAALAQAFAKRTELRAATLVGAVGGLLADVDIFIRSANDPLLNLEWHRHFTHALVFVPIGGWIAALLCGWFLRRRMSFRKIYAYACLGYMSAGVLDACTTYGTYWLWPFTDARIAWNVIAIIDPIFTLTLVVLTVVACIRCACWLGRLSVVFAVLYLSLGVWQRERAYDAMAILAEQRGHRPTRMLVHPTIGNIILWRSLYEKDDRIYVDAVNIGIFDRVPHYYPGDSVAQYARVEQLLGVEEGTVLAEDIKRFATFSADWLGYPKGDPPYVIGDLRYSMIPNSLDPLWGIIVHPAFPDRHAPFEHYRTFDRNDRALFFQMLFKDTLGH